MARRGSVRAKPRIRETPIAYVLRSLVLAACRDAKADAGPRGRNACRCAAHGAEQRAPASAARQALPLPCRATRLSPVALLSPAFAGFAFVEPECGRATFFESRTLRLLLTRVARHDDGEERYHLGLTATSTRCCVFRRAVIVNSSGDYLFSAGRDFDFAVRKTATSLWIIVAASPRSHRNRRITYTTLRIDAPFDSIFIDYVYK